MVSEPNVVRGGLRACSSGSARSGVPGVYHLIDPLFSAFAAGIALLAAQSLLPGEWGHLQRMFAGMFIGMAAGNLVSFFFSPLLGMFETMYLGGFAGMAAGMAGGMFNELPAFPDGVIIAMVLGGAVWLFHFLLDKSYKQRSG